VFCTLRFSSVRILVGTGLLLVAGCGGKTPVAPTPVLAISCPSSAAARAAVGTSSVAVSYSAPTTTGGQAPVTMVCAPTSGSMFPVGTNTVSCTANDTGGRSAACTFSVTIDPAPVPKLAYTKYLGFGDSETEGKVTAVPLQLFQNSYTLKLQPMLQARYTTQTIVVADDGFGGQEVADPATLSRFDAALARETPQVVLIMDGANDLYNQQNDGIAPAISAIAALGQHATDKGVQVFLATLPPADPSKSKGGGAAATPAFNAQLVNLANVRNWTLVDVNAAFHGDLGLIGSDGLHPTDAGYQVIAQAFYDRIVAKYDTTAGAAVAFRR
jgi:lysophospholipase L1-like esterase